jgi:hypothetical protein
MQERFNWHAWKACVCSNMYRGFESLSLRQNDTYLTITDLCHIHRVIVDVTIVVMFITSFLSWWYGPGWLQVVSSLESRSGQVMDIFSVNQLFKTLFAPWRRIISYPGASLAEKFRAWGDNVFSRTIGFFVRLLVILAAFFSLFLVLVLSLLELVIWPLMPPAIIGLVIVGLV